MNFMKTLQSGVQFFLDLGPSVFLPIVIFILAFVFGAKPGEAIRSALMVGVAFVGINLVIALLFNNLGPAAKAMVERFGIRLYIIDVGWPAAAAIAFGSDVSTVLIPSIILLNLLLLLTGVTKTINIDIFNFWHFAFAGAMVQAVTGNIWLGLISGLIFSAITLFFADWTAPAVQKLLNMPGVSLPHGFSAIFVAPAVFVNKILDKIPVINRIQADPEAIKKRFGAFGEPVILGFIIGLGIALPGYAGIGDPKIWVPKSLQAAISLASVMVLTPCMVKLLINDGLIPLSEAARKFLQKRTKGKELYLGLNSAVAMGHPTSIATSLIMVPITLALAFILPGNRVLPFGDLATIPFVVAMMIPIVKGNVVRATITCTLIMIPTLYIMNLSSGVHSRAAKQAGLEFPEGATEIASMAGGGNWVTGLFIWAANNFWIGNILIIAVLAVFWTLYKRKTKSWTKLVGGE